MLHHSEGGSKFSRFSKETGLSFGQLAISFRLEGCISARYPRVSCWVWMFCDYRFAESLLSGLQLLHRFEFGVRWRLSHHLRKRSSVDIVSIARLEKINRTYRNKINRAHDQGQNPCGKNDLPKCHTKMVLTHIFPVQIAQHSGTKHEHRYPQGDESRIMSE